MKRILTIFLGMVFVIIPVYSGDQKISVEAFSPVVIKTVPQAGELAVDPKINQIKVTFSKEMMTNNQWSWVSYSNDSFPKITGKIHYQKDRRTCVLPVKLESGKTYVIWINSKNHNFFKDTSKNSAIPYLLVFKTR